MPFIDMSQTALLKQKKVGFLPCLPCLFPLLSASYSSLCKDLVNSGLGYPQFFRFLIHIFLTSARSSYKPQADYSQPESWKWFPLLSTKYFHYLEMPFNSCGHWVQSQQNRVRILSSHDFWNCWKTIACTDFDKSYRSSATLKQDQLCQYPT